MAAINGALPPRPDGIQGQMWKQSAQVQHHDQRMSDFERQLKDTTAGRSTGSGAASSAASSEPQPEPAIGFGTMHPPKHQRTVLVVGGFPCDSERDVTCEKLREIFGQEPGVKGRWTPGKVGSVGKVNFHTNDHAWTFLRKCNCRKVSHGSKQLWHTWDRPKEEVLLSKRDSLAIKALRTRAVEKGFLTNGAEMGIDGDWERSRVWFKRIRTEERVSREIVLGWMEDLAALWNEAMDEVNLREKERLPAPRFACSHLLSWNVAQVLAVPPVTRGGASRHWECGSLSMATSRKNLAEREVSAWRRFYEHHHLLCDNKVALKHRLRLLTSWVVSSMHWCAGSWILACTQCAPLRAVLDRMLRKMIHVPRLPDESAVSDMARWARLLRICRAKHKFPHGDEKVLCKQLLVVRAHCTDCDERPEEGIEHIVPAQKHCLVAEPEKGNGHTMSWTSFRSLD